VGASPIIFHRLSLNIKTTPSNIPALGSLESDFLPKILSTRVYPFSIQLDRVN
jgi:hypothetical protein